VQSGGLALPRRRATVPRLAVPSKNVIEPMGVPPTRARFLTVAVKLTSCPRVAGLGNAVRTVRVGLTGFLGPGRTLMVAVALALV